MKILDRYVIISFLKNYLISFMVLVGMYVILDMIFRFEDFAEMQSKQGATGYAAVVQMIVGMADYYFFQCFLFFVQLSGIIPVVAAAFTLMRFSRFNELAAVLAAGVPLLRVAMPIIIVSVALNALLLVDQELVIPKLIPKLVRDPEDMARIGPKKYPIQLMQDISGSGLLNAGMYDPAPQPALVDVEIQQRDEAGQLVTLHADRAIWDGLGWSLVNGRRGDGTGEAKAGKADVVSYFRTEIDPRLVERSGRRDPATGLQPVSVRDASGESLRAAHYEPAAPPTMHYLDFIEQRDGQVVAHITADKAVWDQKAQLWRLTNGTRVEGLQPGAKRSPETQVEVFRTEISPEAIAVNRTSDFVEFLSTAQIDALLESRAYGQSSLLRVKHFRFTQPLMNVVLLLLAIPCVLIREPGKMKFAITQCLVVTSICMSGIFMSHQLAGQNTLGPDWAATWPALMAWVPVFIFLPVAIWMLDRLHSKNS
jgi:lipopolysaccharide export LptBFGC system permease protein LptF